MPLLVSDKKLILNWCRAGLIQSSFDDALDVQFVVGLSERTLISRVKKLHHEQQDVFAQIWKPQNAHTSASRLCFGLFSIPIQQKHI